MSSHNKNIKKLFLIFLDATKISIGCAIAIAVSAILGLRYSITAGLIAVLSIQNTKKETASIAIKRLTAFAAAIAISFFDFKFLGYNTYSFTVYLFIFIILCQLFGLQSASILERMADRVLIPDKSGYDGKCFERIDTLLRAAKKTASVNANNSFSSTDKYDLMYLEMREEQCAILYEMYKDIREINATPEQVHVISDFLRKISFEYYEENDVISKMKHQKMPETRSEFENRALLFSLLIKIREFLSIKHIFIKSNG